MSTSFDIEAFLTDENAVSVIFDGWSNFVDGSGSHQTNDHGLQVNPSQLQNPIDKSGYADNNQNFLPDKNMRDAGDAEDAGGTIYHSLPPDLDMTSALGLLKILNEGGKNSSNTDRNFVHGQATSNSDTIFPYLFATRDIRQTAITLEEACEIPEKPLRNALVNAYFKHVHPLCPVVDESEFYDLWTDNLNFENRLNNSDELPLFQAMMFAAMAHISDHDLGETPFGSIQEAQKIFFDKTNSLYRRQFTSDHLILTKVSLLLTYWSPYNSEFQVNSYWVDRAFYHARAIQLWDTQQYSGALSCRRRIIWWCCLLRDRFISFGLRRLHRLQEIDKLCSMVEESDFGLELAFPRLLDVRSKRAMIAAFIGMCELSDIVKDIAVFQENSRFEREWSNLFASRDAIIPELARVAHLENQLREWKQNFQLQLGLSGALVPGSSIAPQYAIIICESILASLYLPYVQSPKGSNSLLERFQKVSLRRIKSSASAVVESVQRIESTSAVEDIPMAILAWTTFPMTVYKVLSETEQNHRLSTMYATEYAVFVSFVSRLAPRFQSAEYILKIMTEEVPPVQKSKLR